MRAFALSVVLAISLGSAALAEVAVPTALGPVTISAMPEKVVVYDLPALDTLAALGVTPVGVPDKLYVNYLDDAAANATVVGTLFEPNLETLAGLAPDLVVLGGRSAAQKSAVEQVAPAIDMTIGEALLPDARARIETYGALFEKSDKAAQLLAALDERIAAVKAAGQGQGNALIVMTNGPKLAAYGANSRFGWLHEATGMAPATARINEANHGDAVSYEFIAEADPDWLFVIDRGAAVGEAGQSAKATLDNPLVQGTKAWKAGHVVYLDSADAYISAGGYTSTMNLLGQLQAALTKG
ncbi:siderophore ABC transporter substrate-binding protein [Paracoccus laeviglucosivorans]|uniref:Iron complex transport system substrate-binding protein n=1 Tax=Paracoccus laeviglucosivorans TaxID=1197861 RepID=A0A521DQJ7_9RHOB|nr:siderophore ABC transporter substrate-binding protein [Paracoccus laeviglucosivorans]SMO73997.1 iron complex transport system substrate-binding protein [Paracoccus laeviglucosivorans]